MKPSAGILTEIERLSWDGWQLTGWQIGKDFVGDNNPGRLGKYLAKPDNSQKIIFLSKGDQRKKLWLTN